MTTESVDEFDSAKAIYDKLKDIPHERQEMILRWVCERLGIALPTRYVERPQETPIPPPADPALPAPTPQQTTDIKTFIASKKPKSDQQFAAAVAYYYRFMAPQAERKQTINAKALQDAARLAGRAVLHLPKSTLNNTRKTGLLDRAEPGEFRINTVGENLVTMTLPGDGKERKPRARPTRKRQAPKKP